MALVEDPVRCPRCGAFILKLTRDDQEHAPTPRIEVNCPKCKTVITAQRAGSKMTVEVLDQPYKQR
jgi:ribosomal protein S27E